MQRSAIAILWFSGALVFADAAVLSLEQRVTAGECASSTSDRESYYSASFQVTDLPSTRVAEMENLASNGHTRSAVELLIDYGQNFKVLTDAISREQYVLTQCGTQQPTDAQIDAVKAKPSSNYTRKHFTIPVQKMIATSTVQLTFITALGLEDRVVRYTSGAVGACWQKGLGSTCDGQLEPDPDGWQAGNRTVYDAQMRSADMVLLDCGNYQNVDCSSVNAMSNGVHFPTATAVGNLHTAEFIKWIAAFFNKEAAAKTSFAETTSAYEGAATTSEATKKVAWLSFENAYPGWNEDRFKLSLAIYKQELVTAAGGVNIDGDAVKAQIGANMTKTVDWAGNPSFYLETIHYPSKADAAAALLGALSLAAADCVIDETYAMNPASYNISSFRSTFGLTSNNFQVLRYDGALSESNSWDWFESRIAYPHLAVQGLRRVLLPDSSLPRGYFRDISNSEVPEVIAASQCSVALPVCDSSVTPGTIALPPQETTTASAAPRGAMPSITHVLATAATVVALSFDGVSL